MVGARGLEPPTSRSRTVRSTRLSYAPICGEKLPDFRLRVDRRRILGDFAAAVKRHESFAVARSVTLRPSAAFRSGRSAAPSVAQPPPSTMRRRIMRKIIAALVLLLSPLPLLAWGEKGHSIVSEAATFHVPNAMPRFFHAAYPELVYLGYDPDRWRGSGVSADDLFPQDHFLDYEYVEHLDLPPGRLAFIDLLYKSGTLDRLGIRNGEAGFIPWRIAELCDLLTEQWRLWRRAPGDVERRAIEQSIIGLAGVLGHYVADAANPHHTTLNYNGWVEENPWGYATDCETHSRFESRFVSRAMAVGDVAPRVAPLVERSDYFATALGHVKQAHGRLHHLYSLDRDGAFSSVEIRPEAREFAAERLAAAASMLRDLWWSTWIESANPRPRR
jgi:hypothetical protein